MHRDVIDLASQRGKADNLHGRALGGLCMDIPEKDEQGFLWIAGYLFASCSSCGFGVVELKARFGTFDAADRLERLRCIYWLF